MVSIVAVAVIAFASTNIDDILVLVAFFSDRTMRPVQIVLGQFLGMVLLVAVAILCSLTALAIPAAHIALLGVLPIAIGLSRLLQRLRDADRVPVRSTGGAAIPVALVTAANGADNIAVYTPILTGKSQAEVLVVVVVFATMTCFWLCVARFLVGHPRLGPSIQRYGDALFPWILIGLGLSILLGHRSVSG